MIICIDFDGTVVKHEYPKVGEEVVGAVKVLRKLVNCGHQLILYTMRGEQELIDAIQWFEDRNIPLYAVNMNPQQKSWTKSPKVYANLYIDDANLGCPLCYEVNPSDRPYVDWKTVDMMLEHYGFYD